MHGAFFYGERQVFHMEEQQKKSTAEVLVECLKEEGVDTIFGIPGEETLDLTTMFAPITKRTKQIIRPDTVAEITRLAFKYAENEKPGATHIDLPKNIAKMPADVKPLDIGHPPEGLCQ